MSPFQDAVYKRNAHAHTQTATHTATHSATNTSIQDAEARAGYIQRRNAHTHTLTHIPVISGSFQDAVYKKNAHTLINTLLHSGCGVSL